MGRKLSDIMTDIENERKAQNLAGVNNLHSAQEVVDAIISRKITPGSHNRLRNLMLEYNRAEGSDIRNMLDKYSAQGTSLNDFIQNAGARKDEAALKQAGEDGKKLWGAYGNVTNLHAFGGSPVYSSVGAQEWQNYHDDYYGQATKLSGSSKILDMYRPTIDFFGNMKPADIVLGGFPNVEGSVAPAAAAAKAPEKTEGGAATALLGGSSLPDVKNPKEEDVGRKIRGRAATLLGGAGGFLDSPYIAKRKLLGA